MNSWYYIEELDGYGEVAAAVFIRAPGQTVAEIHARYNGEIDWFAKVRTRALPHLEDQIPERFLGLRLEFADLRELDIYCSGDGTGTRPIEERELPWI